MNSPLESLRRAVANGKQIDWDVIAPPKPRMVACVDCGAFYNDAKIASRGRPPLCGKCFTRWLVEGR